MSDPAHPPVKLAVLGGGNMAEAILRGLVGRYDVTVADPSPERRAALAGLSGDRIEIEAVGPDALRPAAEAANLLLIAVKPQVAPDALPALAGAGDAVAVSIMAGVTTGRIDALLGGGRRVVRVMPNTPMMVKRGACGICRGGRAGLGDQKLAADLFKPSAHVVAVDESLMDAVTAVSGSGPAYVFYLAEHLAAAGEAVGLSPEHARQLARQTIVGAAAMLDADDTPPETLRRRVTSPGGTTQAATETFDRLGLPDTLRAAVTAARDRGRELSGG